MRPSFIALLFLIACPQLLAQGEKDPTMFPVANGNTTYYVNKSGEVVLTVPYSAGPFVEDLARIWVNSKTGYIDRSGRIVIEPQFVSSLDFSQGLALFYVKMDCGQAAEGKNFYGFIDRQGKVVIPPTLYRPCSYWGDAFDFKKDGFALTQVEGGWSFIDKTGKVVMKFEDAGYFSEGLAPAKVKGKFGFVDTNGKFVIKQQFERALSFSEGLASVRVDGKNGFINHAGQFVIPVQFDDAVSFSDGMAAVKIGEKWGYIDRTGRVVVEPNNNTRYAIHFSNGRAVISNGREEGYIDKNGKVVIEPQFSRTQEFRDGLAYVLNAETGRWEVIDVDGKVIYRLPEPQRPPPNLNNPLEKIAVTDDVKWLETVAGATRTGSGFEMNGKTLNSTKGLSTAAYARLGELATPESLAAIKRIESDALSTKTITPEFVPLGVSPHPGWHFGDSEPAPLAQVTSKTGTTYGVLFSSSLGGVDLFLISNKTPENSKTWTRPKLLPNHFYWGLREPKLSMSGNDKLIFSFTQTQPPPRSIMDGTLDPRTPAPTMGPQQVEISIKAIEKDSDGDGWTDIEEERLGLSPNMKDTDGDGLSDGADVCPNTSIQSNPNDENEQIVGRALFAVFGLGGSRYVLLVDDKMKKVDFWGYKGPVLYGENVKSWTGKNRAGGVFVSWRIRKKTADLAIVEITDYEGPLAAGGQDVRLRKIGDEWIVVSRRTTWIS